MRDLVVIHHSIKESRSAVMMMHRAIPCLDFYFEFGLPKLVHVSIVEPYVIFPKYARFDILRRDLAVGSTIRKLLVELRGAALVDRGMLAACEACSTRLESLIENVESANNIGPPVDPRRRTPRAGG
jgi:hypothetical protein